MKLNFNFSGKTLLKDWWKIVRDNFTAIQTDHNTLSDKLDTEITQRTNADVGLADKITAETKARESADSSLSSRISKEVTIRIMNCNVILTVKSPKGRRQIPIFQIQ